MSVLSQKVHIYNHLSEIGEVAVIFKIATEQLEKEERKKLDNGDYVQTWNIVIII